MDAGSVVSWPGNSGGGGRAGNRGDGGRWPERSDGGWAGRKQGTQGDGGSSAGEGNVPRRDRYASVSGRRWFWSWGCPTEGCAEEGDGIARGEPPSEESEGAGPEDACGFDHVRGYRPRLARGCSLSRGHGECEGEGGARVGRASGGVASGLLRQHLGTIQPFGFFPFMRFPATSASAGMYWLVRWSISGMVDGGFSISD
ncbi:putative glycine-rich cell wall structural protein 1 [Musa acuminata AAA Group]|uniref:putative glycine-rich cell wall structural protein 1 n=1 Tax=Musa acuminata AAA Group TaxID=214697 RepID=UPI0031D83D76